MGYTDDPSMVRVDFFKPSGKWYTTKAVKWVHHGDKGLIIEEFADSLYRHLSHGEDDPAIQAGQRPPGMRMSDMVAVCLEPYSLHSHPQMLRIERVIPILEEKKQRETEKARLEDVHRRAQQSRSTETS